MPFLWTDDVRESQDTLHVLVQQQLSLGGGVLKQFPSQHVLRIFQLDALQLEGEVLSVLKTTLDGVLNIGPLEFLKFRYPDEIQLLLQLVLYKFGVWDSHQSVWDRMQNIMYRNERGLERTGLGDSPLAVVWSERSAPTKFQKIWHLCLTIVIPYLLRRLLQRCNEEGWGTEGAAPGWRPVAARALKFVSAVSRAASLVHMLIFLMEGKYRSVADRVVGMRLVHGEQRMTRIVNVMYLNQHIAWLAWSGFLNVALPLLRVGSAWTRISAMGGSMLANVSAGEGFVREGHCCACREPAVLGRKSNCGHLYCYYCIASRLPSRAQNDDADVRPSFPCLQCGATVTSASR